MRAFWLSPGRSLLDLVKMNDLRTYNAVLDQFGAGDGCETCKPVVASLLASLWNENVLEKGPRSRCRILTTVSWPISRKAVHTRWFPGFQGGEITPEKLIVIGAVAQKYGLYTKITGGQRIDLCSVPTWAICPPFGRS